MIIIIFFLIHLSLCDTNWVFYLSDLTQSPQASHNWQDVATSTLLTSYMCLSGILYYYVMLQGTAEIQNTFPLPTRLFNRIRIQIEIHFLQDQDQEIQIMANNIVLKNEKIQISHDPTSLTGDDCSGVPYKDGFTLYDLYFPYTTPQPNNLIVNIKSTGTGIYTISNFFMWVAYCDPQCLECDQDRGCLKCGNGFTISDQNCKCFEYYFISGSLKQCVEDCPAGYYPDNHNVCQVGIETNLYQDLIPLTFTTYNFIWTADLYYSQSINSNKLITIETQTVAGPFYYNEKIAYNINIAANTLIKGQFSYYLFGATFISRSVLILMNGLQIGYLADYFELMAYLPQAEISSSSCFTTNFTQCTKYQVEFTYSSQTITNSLEFQTKFPLTTTDSAWGIRDLILSQLVITGTTTLASCPTNCAICFIDTCTSCSIGYLYNGTCVSACPTYLSTSGSLCIDNDLGTRGYYLLRGFTGPLESFSIFNKIFQTASVEAQSTTSVYKGNWIFGGYNVNSWTSASNLAYFDNIPYHYAVIVKFKGVLVDGTGSIRAYVDTSTFDSTNTGVSANCVGSLTNENEVVGSGTILHTASTMKLQIQCISTGGICGVYDLVVIIKRCPSYCSLCTSETVCTTYLSTSNNTLSSCNLKYYYDAKTDQCLSCEVGCDVCNTGNKCTQCSTGYLLSYDDCYNPNGFEVSAQTTQCSNGCSLCFYSQNCLVCNVANKFWMNSGLCSCIPGYYQDDDFSCQLCHPICKTCIKQPRQCTSCYVAQFRTYNYDNCLCSDGYFQEYDNNICSICDTICRTCISISSFCTSCQATQFRVLSGSYCVCQEGYYDSAAYICSVCSDQCFGCKDFSYCLSCHTSQFKQLSIFGGTCVCNSGYYLPSTGLTCLQCNIQCLQCSDGTSTDCTRCPLTRIQTLQTTKFGCKCLTGYYDNGGKDCLSCLTVINPLPDNYCYSLCGDGIVQWNEECDDANTNTRDSCINCHFSNSECLKETCTGCFANKCISCIDGYFITESNKCEQCDESCVKCKDKADNCTQCLFNSLSGAGCLKCPKSQGYKFDNGKCSNICGDGLVVANEKCDDGNLKTGDGCDQTCQVEKGWMCNQICTRIEYPQLSIEEDKFDQYFDSQRKVSIKVTQPLMITGSLMSNLNYSILEMPNANFSFLDLTNYDTQYINIQFELTITLTQASDNVTLQIIIQSQNFKSQQNQTFNVSNYNYSLTYYNPPSQGVISATAGVMSLNQYILYVLLGLAAVAFLFGGLDIFWNLLDNLQLLSYLQYFNVVYPYNLVNYFTIFGFAQFSFISQYISIEGIISNDIDTPQADYAFAEQGYSSVFIINIVTVLTVFLTTLLIYLGCQLLFLAIEKVIVQEISEEEIDYDDQSIFQYFLFRLTKNLQQTLAQITREFKSGLLRTYMAVAFDYNLAIFLQFKGFHNEGILLFSGILSILAFLIEIYFIFQGFLLLSRQQYFLKLRSTRNEIGSLYEGLEIYSFRQFYNILSLCKKMLFMMFLVLFYDCPALQILMVTTLNMIQLVYIIRYKPFEDELEYYKNIGSEFILWTTELTIILFTYDFTDNQLINIGWAVMALSTFFIFYQLFFDVKQHAEFLASEYVIIRKMMNKIASLLNRQQFERQNFIKSPSSKTASSKKTLSKLKIRKFVTFTIAGQK